MNKEKMRASSENNIIETEVAIKFIKDVFERELARNLNLTRVSAPLFVFPESGLNDNLNGVERPVAFDIADIGKNVEVVHSLAKWKRMALAKYGFAEGEGLYTDMNAIRRDEALDALHSVYVDQWDWEKIISPAARNFDTLKAAVNSIYAALLSTESALCARFNTAPMLPEKIEFMTTSELESEFPELSPRERENAITKRLGAVFLMQIGAPLKDGKPHDGRAPDYDDWSLNGDILRFAVRSRFPPWESAWTRTPCAASLPPPDAKAVRSCRSTKRCLRVSCPRPWAAASGSRAYACSCSANAI